MLRCSVAVERHLLPRVAHIPHTGNCELELAPGCGLRRLQNLRKDRCIKLTQHLCRLATYIHPQACLKVNNNIERAFDGDAAGRRIAAIDSIGRGVQEANHSVVECHHKIDSRSAFERGF